MTQPLFAELLRLLRGGVPYRSPFTPRATTTARGDDLPFKVSMLGPTSVGKTSLISALLREAESALIGTKVILEPYDVETEQRIVTHRRKIEGALYAGEFDPEAVKPNVEEVIFRLRLATGSDEVGIRFDLLDYPGGWLDPHRRGVENQESWEECLRFMAQSSVLIVPIDAVLIMEAQLTKQKQSLPFLLAPGEVRDIALRWASERAERPDEPALLVFAPTKCESYFADNGGLHDESEKLYNQTTRLYGQVRTAVMATAPHTKIYYVPVDTLGCVQLISAKWRPNAMFEGTLECLPHFAIRPPAMLRPKAVDSILFLLCRQLTEARSRTADVVAKVSADRAAEAAALADRSEGLFRDLFLRLIGEKALRERSRDWLAGEARREMAYLDRLTEVVDKLAEQPHNDRVRQW
ncbi:MAG TPA: hypothetical protein VFB84_05170 [Micromonosporaceae bacterium]|nr:hypothetical protein [Micromonosporaceae bacterium]